MVQEREQLGGMTPQTLHQATRVALLPRLRQQFAQTARPAAAVATRTPSADSSFRRLLRRIESRISRFNCLENAGQSPPGLW